MNKEVVDAFLNLIVTAIGVFLGLFLTLVISRRSDKGVYHAIDKSVHFEAETNKKTLETSFKKYVLVRGLVLNEFRVDVALNSLANPLFWLIRLNRGAAVWFWMALAVIGGCRPTVLGGVDSRAS